MSASSETKRRRSVSSVIWTVVGIVLALWFFGYVVELTQRYLGSGRAIARVVETFADEREREVNGRTVDVGYVTVAIYQFSYNGKAYRGSIEGAQGSYQVGDVLDVGFYKGNPQVNRVLGDNKELRTFLVTLAIVGFIGLVIFEDRRRKRNEEKRLDSLREHAERFRPSVPADVQEASEAAGSEQAQESSHSEPSLPNPECEPEPGESFEKAPDESTDVAGWKPTPILLKNKKQKPD